MHLRPRARSAPYRKRSCSPAQYPAPQATSRSPSAVICSLSPLWSVRVSVPLPPLTGALYSLWP